MTATVFQLFKAIFQAVIAWLGTIFEAIGATEYVLAFVAIAILTSVFILPLRGSRLASADLDLNMTFSQPIHKFTRMPWYTQKELPTGRSKELPRGRFKGLPDGRRYWISRR